MSNEYRNTVTVGIVSRVSVGLITFQECQVENSRSNQKPSTENDNLIKE